MVPPIDSSHLLFMRIILIQFLCIFAAAVNACHLTSSNPTGAVASQSKETQEGKFSSKVSANAAPYGPPIHLADLEEQTINESSGIVASRLNPDLFWTHNDSGDGPFLYAFDRQGKKRGIWRVTGATARDWEDIALGPGPQPNRPYIYVGDIGDNGTGRRQITIYRVAEPAIVPADADSTKTSPRQTDTAEAIRLMYPDGSHDAEALMIHPVTGDLYIVTKMRGSIAGVYKLPAPFSASTVHPLTRIGEVRVPTVFGGLITGGDISPDGRRVALCDYTNAYEMSLPNSSRSPFDGIWNQPLMSIELGPRQQGEAICYSLDGASLLATSEKRPTPLIEVRRLKQR